MKKSIFLLLITPMLLTSCSLFSNFFNNDPVEPDPVEPEPDPDPEDPDPEDPTEGEHQEDDIHPNLKKNKDTYNKFFDPTSKVEIELDFTNKAITKLRDYGEKHGNSNYTKNEMYHPCTFKVTINGDTSTYYEVGARMRGNTSRDLNFVNDNGQFSDSHFIHFKLSFEESFTSEKDNDYYITTWSDATKQEAREDRTFADLKKLDLKWNKNYDSSFTKEIYSLNAYREEGLIAQRVTLVNLTVKSESSTYTKVYQAFESVDKRMIKKNRSDDNTGDLYKCLWKSSKADLTTYENNNVGIEDVDYEPAYDLKTNKKTSDMHVIKDLIDHINVKGTTGEEFYEDISNYLDVDEFLKYSALCFIFGLPDDFRNNNNNYYLYFTSENKAIFIPYDNDRCLGIRKDWDKDLKNVVYDESTAIGYNDWNSCPLVHRFLSGKSNNSYKVYQQAKDTYYNYCVEYANKYLNNQRFEEFSNQFYYSSHDYSGGPSNDSFAVYAAAKLATLN